LYPPVSQLAGRRPLVWVPGVGRQPVGSVMTRTEPSGPTCRDHLSATVAGSRDCRRRPPAESLRWGSWGWGREVHLMKLAPGERRKQTAEDTWGWRREAQSTQQVAAVTQRHLRGAAKALRRHAGHTRPEHVKGIVSPGRGAGHDPRRQAVHPDPGLGPLDSQAPAQVLDTCPRRPCAKWSN
jgi:hypothetical protein